MNKFCKDSCEFRDAEVCALTVYGSAAANTLAVAGALGRGVLNHHNRYIAQQLTERLEARRVGAQMVEACVEQHQKALEATGAQ